MDKIQCIKPLSILISKSLFTAWKTGLSDLLLHEPRCLCKPRCRLCLFAAICFRSFPPSFIEYPSLSQTSHLASTEKLLLLQATFIPYMEEKNTSELPPSLRRHIIRRDQPPQPISHREGRFHDDTLPPLAGGPQIPLGGLPHYHPGHGRGTSVVDPIRPLPGPAALIGRRSPSPGYPSTPPRQPPFASTSQFQEPPRHPSVWQEGEAGPSSLQHAQHYRELGEGPRYRLPRISPPPVPPRSGQIRPPLHREHLLICVSQS